MIFSSEQIQEVLETIHQQHILFIGENVGKDILTRDDISLLKKYGVNVEKMGVGFTPYERAYYFGMLSEILGDVNAKTLQYGDFKKYLQYGQYLPLTIKEEDTLRAIKTQSYSNIKNLGSRISNDVSNVIGEQESISRGKYETVIREEAERMVRDRKAITEMVSNIGYRTGDWERDLGRLAETEMHNAFEEGRASSLERKGGKEANAYKDVYPGACRHCIRLYLAAGIGSKPIIFKLSELRANGNNIGKKVDQWKAIIGATHPFCRCTLHERREGYEWDEETRGFTELKPFARKVERRSKIKIRVGEKEYVV